MKNIVFILILIVGIVSCNQSGKTKSGQYNQAQETIAKSDTTGQDTTQNEMKKPKPRVQEHMPLTLESVKLRNAAQAYHAGVEFYKQGELDSALIEFKKALNDNPESGNISHYLGRIYYDMGQKQLSLSYYKDAAKYNENDSLSTLGIGQVYFDIGDSTNAMKYYNKAIEMAPNYALAYYNRGTLLGIQNKYIKALDDLNRSIELDNTNGNAYVNRGLAYYFLEQTHSACRDWKKAASMGFEKAQKAVDQYCK